MDLTRAIPAELASIVVLPGAAGWDAARRAWNLAVDQQPAAVARPTDAGQVAAIVNLARALGLRVAPQGTGHAPGPRGSLAGSILLRTDGMRGVEIDTEARTARIEAGVVSGELVSAAAAHGLAALVGTAADVGVVGFTLGGGIGWLSRSHGLASGSVQAVELVTPDGRLLRADREHEPDLFWALRGGGGSFGVVTALELALVPLTEAYVVTLWWPIERGADVLSAWGELTRRGDLPDALTTVGRLLRFPPIPQIPEPVRGRSFAIVELVHLGDPVEVDRLIAPLRVLRPTTETAGPMPIEQLARVHMDPDEPVPGAGDGVLLRELPAEAIAALMRVAGSDAGSGLLGVELRQLGGALARTRTGSGALAAIDGAFLAYAVGLAATPEMGAASQAQVRLVLEALAPWASPRMYLNFAETPRAASTFWDGASYARLRRIRDELDPAGLMHPNHALPA